MTYRKLGFTIPISRALAIEYGVIDPTPEEATEMRAQAEQYRREEAERRAQPGPALTLDNLLEHLGWTPEYAAHRLHPACYCDDGDDPTTCTWARELGLDRWSE